MSDVINSAQAYSLQTSIPLSSDTETKPSAAMREAIARAEVGDEQKGEDPSVNLLTEKVAALLGKEAALFLPSGTMCNLVAIKAHTQPGEFILADRMAHVLRAETGAPGLISGVMTEAIDGLSPFGCFSADQLREAMSRISMMPYNYSAKASLVCLEQTQNFGGGAIWPLPSWQAVCEVARSGGAAIHVDGARLMNAVVASGISAAHWASTVDSVWIDFTKGLGCPIGAVLAGDRMFIEKARRVKHIVGGAMRQAGIAAGGCLYALDHHIGRLHVDHQNAKRLAEGLRALPGLRLCFGMPQTNIVFFEFEDPQRDNKAFAAAAAAKGLKLSAIGRKLRAVTHLDVSETQIDQALTIIRSL
jgi:threonine aldolase